MKHAKECSNARVFSYQDHMNGQRRFLVSTYKEFWRRYKDMNPKFRHHYEVIQEGLPCHLYFDLEFNMRENPDKNGDEMVDLLLTVVFDALLEKYSIGGNKDWVVELDSSTKEKFSRHLIIRLPKTAFKDNSHAGAFVTEICSRAYLYKETDGRFKNLFVSKDSSSADNQCQLFVDTAVYSRNRCFRLPLSSKAGKSSILLPSGRFKCKDMSEGEVFMESLICNMDADCEKLLICKMDLDCVKALHFDTEVTSSSCKHSCFPPEFHLDACTSDASKTYLMGKSPFSALDVFVETVASIGNVSGKIRSWYWFSEYGLMVYNMSRNRYCERIGRQHKSNHVIYVVDLRRAVYYQKCHDPDCRGYRSPLRPIPDGVLPDSSCYFNLARDCDDQGHVYLAGEESTPGKEKWWLEAIEFADQVEHIQKSLYLTGVPLASIDATELTLYRTACVSALASFYLSREDSETLLMIGSGSLAPHLIKAHLSVRPKVKKVIVWNRTEEKARNLVEKMSNEGCFEGVCFESGGFLEEVVKEVDIISCATNAEIPLVKGVDLKAGTHLDLVGSFKHSMKECDDEAIRKGRVFVDNEAALTEAGELVGAFERGVITKDEIAGDLVGLINGEKPERKNLKEITVFKSVGSAVVDLLSAQLVYENYMKSEQ
ncbi:DNA-directed primase/polymerase protein [Forsythia ovata]|uniref:DNA-directed primase/polymerase protein n=1 Tax=Forsythia ovata TaxID=205694 RepID=A0ABD1WLG5_9LAMI